MLKWNCSFKGRKSMKKQLIIIGIIVMLVCIGLSGCTNTTISDEERLIGTWDVSMTSQGKNIREDRWEFRSDHTYETISSNGTWKITNNKLILTYTTQTQSTKTMDYVFSNNYNTITITDTDIIDTAYVCNRLI
jgi:hypothetical protein